jgi:N utilization substance protein B
MINRELIRTKIVQLTYAYYQNGSKNIENAEKELLLSLSKAYDLYNYLLDLIVAITKEETQRVEQLSIRNRREGKEEPSTKFIFNKFAVQLQENKTLNSFNEDKNMSWNDDIDFVRNLCDKIEQSDTYKEYMASTDNDYEADRELWRKLYRQLIEDNDDLDQLLETKSLYWNDDKEVVDTFVLKTIKRFDPKEKGNQELLPEYKDEEDREFARKLFRATILNANEYQRYMSETSRNWDFSRLAYMDIVIMQIAIAELLNFPNIPVSVTINEYVDMAKRYSTPRSGGYINGMLDSIARHLADTGKLLKPMPPRPERGNYSDRRQQNDRYQNDRYQNGGRQNEGYNKPVRFVHKPKPEETNEAPAEEENTASDEPQNTPQE